MVLGHADIDYTRIAPFCREYSLFYLLEPVTLQVGDHRRQFGARAVKRGQSEESASGAAHTATDTYTDDM
jgi:hypothetical protein